MDASGISLDENLRRLATVPLSFAPGTRWQYSLSTDVLGAVVARAAGKPLPAAVSQLVTAPLRMRDTGFWTTRAERLTVPYHDGKPRPVRMTEDYFAPTGGSGIPFAPGRALDRTAFPSGGAGMVGSAYDYLKFLEALRQGGAPLLKQKTGRALAQNQLRGQKADQVNPGWTFGLLSSVLVDAKKGKTPQSLGTLTWGGAYGHMWFVDRKAGLSVVVMTNTAFEGMWGKFPEWIRDAAYGR
jgi:CubicO group peptidase (beta-lactamase class C family)